MRGGTHCRAWESINWPARNIRWQTEEVCWRVLTGVPMDGIQIESLIEGDPSNRYRISLYRPIVLTLATHNMY